jgi:hypothetical protein
LAFSAARRDAQLLSDVIANGEKNRARNLGRGRGILEIFLG